MASHIDHANAADTDINAYKAFAKNPHLEVWYHGYGIPKDGIGPFYDGVWKVDNDGDGEPDGWAESDMKSDFDKGIEEAEKIGIEFTAFNPPSNAIGGLMANYINENHSYIEVLMRCSASRPLSLEREGYTTLWRYMSLDTVDLDSLKSKWKEQMNADADYVLLQGHPAQWAKNAGREEVFKEFVEWLIAHDVVFMTPTEYARSIEN